MPPKRIKQLEGSGSAENVDATPNTVVTAVSVLPSPSSSLAKPPPAASTKAATRTSRTLVASESSPLTRRRDEADDAASTNTESPLKKLKRAMSNNNRRLVKSIEDLRDFIAHNDVTDPDVRGSIRIQARLLWAVNETVHGLRFLRLYLGEEREPEPLHEQQAIYQIAQRDDAYEANQFLITLSLYDIAADNPSLPQPGDVIAFIPTKLRLYRNCCQVETRLHHIAPVSPL